MTNAITKTATLSRSGYEAKLFAYEQHPGVNLSVDGVLQSNVDMEHPGELHFTYARCLGDMLDFYFPGGSPVTALHLGAGAMTFPRYFEATRPGSKQVAVELEEDLLDFVLDAMPLQPNIDLEIICGDAREVAESMTEGSFDFILADIYSGASSPAHVTSLEFYATLSNLLTPNGIMVVNVADDSEEEDSYARLSFTRNQLATIKEAFGSALLVVDSEDLVTKKLTNVLIAGAKNPTRLDGLVFSAKNRRPHTVVSGQTADEWVAEGSVVTDETAKSWL